MQAGLRARIAVFLRSLAIQGSWNYRSLIGSGFAFALLPALRALYGDDPEKLRSAVERHSGLFNSHPYMAPMALGAVVTLESGEESPAIIDRFKGAIRGSLGSLGDRLVWAAWRPACLLLALVLLFAGAPWWLPFLVFLALYNIGHLALRVWAYRFGLARGKQVGLDLKASRVGSIQQILSYAGPLLLGMALPLLIAGRMVGMELSPGWWLAAAAAAAVGLQAGPRVRGIAEALLVALAALGFLAGLVI